MYDRDKSIYMREKLASLREHTREAVRICSTPNMTLLDEDILQSTLSNMESIIALMKLRLYDEQ